MRFPDFVREGDVIGFAAPSFGCDKEPYNSAFRAAIKNFTDFGFGTDIGPNCFVGAGVGISNTPQKCAAELHTFFTEKDVAAVISCGGGELMCEILDFVDFSRMAKASPKWFMGYSDNTNLTFLLTTLCDTAAVYGPCAPAFGMESWHPALDDALGILTGQKMTVHNYPLWERESKKDENHPLVPYHVTEKFCLRRFPDRDLFLQGRLLGGCLDCLANLVGTKFDRVKEFSGRYRDDGILWFLEACDLSPMGIRRALWQLDHAGWFDTARGFLFGRPLCMQGEDTLSADEFGLDRFSAVTEVLAHHGVPIVMDLDIGHLPPMMPMVSGALAKVTAKQNSVAVDFCLA